MNQSEAPLFDKLCSMASAARASFHVPGHKFGQSLNDEEATVFKHVMAIDYTEITGLDDLHDPHDVIARAQQLAAQCFGAEHTFFLVNGSTAGNLALILTVCSRGDVIIVQRDVHKSVLHGLMLAGAQAVFIPPRFDPRNGLSIGVAALDVEQALHRYPQAKAVLLTNPSYYGRGINLEPIAALVHKFDIPLLIDEAHGAHYGFHPSLPPSALASGADGVVQSTHKMLTAMTMGAMLHLQGPRLNAQVVQQKLAMIQSSSPSYPIMASLDMSRRLIATEGTERLQAGLDVVVQFKEALQQLPHLKCFALAPAHDRAALVSEDPFKVVLYDATGTLSGFDLQRALERYGCHVEMADLQYVVLAFSLASSLRDVEMLCDGLQNISADFQLEKKEIDESASNKITLPAFEQSPEPVPFDRDLFHAEEVETVSFAQAVQRRSAQMVIPYPPGIPILFPGETITPQLVMYLEKLLALGATFQGTSDIQEHRLQVLK